VILIVSIILLWQQTVGKLAQSLKRQVARLSGAIGEVPGRISLNFSLLANRQLAFAVRGRALDAGQEFGRAAEARFLILAVGAPKCAVVLGAAVFDALRESVELTRLAGSPYEPNQTADRR